MASWRKVLGKADRDVCRWCKRNSETGEHLVFEYIHWDFRRPTRKIGGEWRKWKLWEDPDLKVWVDKGGEGKKNLNHVYIFFSELPLDAGRGVRGEAGVLPPNDVISGGRVARVTDRGVVSYVCFSFVLVR